MTADEYIRKNMDNPENAYIAAHVYANMAGKSEDEARTAAQQAYASAQKRAAWTNFVQGQDPETPAGNQYIGKSATFADSPDRDYAARAMREQIGLNRRPIEYSDAFLKQEDQKDAWSPNWENGEAKDDSIVRVGLTGHPVVDGLIDYILTGKQYDTAEKRTLSTDWHTDDSYIERAMADSTPEPTPTPAKDSKNKEYEYQTGIPANGNLNPVTGVNEIKVTEPVQGESAPQSEPVRQYMYPENSEARLRFQSTMPHEDWQKALIDEMNAAYDERDFSRQKQLLDIYNSGYDAYSRYDYERSLPEGATPYDEMTGALGSGSIEDYNTARNNLLGRGYTENEVDTQTADWIHENGGSTKDREAMLQEYLGLSPSDAEATSVLWWWTDSNGKGEADTDANGKLKQDELGSYLKTMEEGGTLSEAQAATIWNDSFPTAKTDYTAWKGKGTKKEKSQVFTDADSNGNNRLTQAELGAYLMRQQAGGMTDEEAAKIWAEEFPSAKTDYAKWKGKQK